MSAVLGLLAVVGTAFAGDDDVKSVTGIYTYYGESHESRKDCERRALELAKVQALADEFGTTVTQNVMQNDVRGQSGEHTFFSALSESEVKGEWISDDGKPEYEIAYDKDYNLIVKCKIKGKARRISNHAVDFKASVLKNGTEPRFESTEFKQGDDMFLSFSTPVDGFLAVYLVGEDNVAYTLLPYMADSEGIAKVKKNRDYIFFSKDHKTGIVPVDEFRMSAATEVEYNRMYVVFSPEEFIKAVDGASSQADKPRALPYEDFSSWLRKCRKRDDRMSVKTFNLTIKQ